VILWTDGVPGSDNAIGDLPFIAPMKTELLKSAILEKEQRGGVTLLLCVCLTLLVLTPALGQVKVQKHVTGIQLGGAAEGSRVTVVSDSPLIDYEAFRRGDRFHVKLPLTDLSSAAPRFRADGFEDVQAQKVGDSLIVSFKLQPGATARVDQHGNRLDVVFSAANRIAYSAPENPQRTGDHGRDAAGPTPLDSAPFSTRGDSRWTANPRIAANKNSNKAGDNQLTAGNTTASPSPSLSPSSILSPGSSSSYQPGVTATPAAGSSSTPVTGAPAAGSFLNWRARAATARQWMSANRLATLLGLLILLSLIVYLVIAIRRRRETGNKTRQAKTPKVQPRYSPGAELNELPNARVSEQVPSRESAPPKPQGAFAAPALTRPTIVSPSAGQNEHTREEEEREVFEL
jgi:hypothetical protein